MNRKRFFASLFSIFALSVLPKAKAAPIPKLIVWKWGYENRGGKLARFEQTISEIDHGNGVIETIKSESIEYVDSTRYSWPEVYSESLKP